MEQVKCPSCGASVGSGDASCRYCGESLSRSSQPNYSAPAQQPQVIVVNAQPNQQSSLPVYSSDKSKITAAILAFFLGGIGIHKFYLNKAGLGILYILFCWTLIPSFVAVIEGIIYLTMNDYSFNEKYNRRIA